MLLGIPLLTVLLVLAGPFLAVTPAALTAAISWPSAPRRRTRPIVFAPRFAGGAW